MPVNRYLLHVFLTNASHIDSARAFRLLNAFGRNVSTLTALETFLSLPLRWTVSTDAIGQSAAEAIPLPLLAPSTSIASAPFRFARSGFTIVSPRVRHVPSSATFCFAFLIPLFYLLESCIQLFFGCHSANSCFVSQCTIRNTVDDVSH